MRRLKHLITRNQVEYSTTGFLHIYCVKTKKYVAVCSLLLSSCLSSVIVCENFVFQFVTFLTFGAVKMMKIVVLLFLPDLVLQSGNALME